MVGVISTPQLAEFNEKVVNTPKPAEVNSSLYPFKKVGTDKSNCLFKKN